jgi:hypothetical protein
MNISMDDLKRIAEHLPEVGLWKFWLLALGLAIVLILNIVPKEKTKMNKIAIVSSGVLFLLNLILIILSYNS